MSTRSKSRSRSPAYRDGYCERNKEKLANSRSRSISRSPVRNGGRGHRSRSRGSPRDDKEEFFIKSDMAKHIVGRGGSKVRNLEDITCCRITVSREETRDGKLKVELTGNSRHRERAKRMIEDIIEADGRVGLSGRGFSGGGGGYRDRGYSSGNYGGSRYDDRGYGGSRYNDRGSGSYGGGGSGGYRSGGGGNSHRDSRDSYRGNVSHGCYHCGRDGHYARECPEFERVRRY